MAMEAVNEVYVCPVNPVTDKITTHELSVGPDLVIESVGDPSISPVSLNDPDYELPICSVSVNESNFKLSVLPVSITELSTNLVPVNASGCELSACLVGSRDTVDELLVFPASVFEIVNARSVSCVSVFPRLQSLLWFPAPSWCSPAPLWCSPALSAPH